MVRKQLLKPALYRYFSVASNKFSLAFHVTNAFSSGGESTLPSHLAPILAPGCWSQTICTAHMHTWVFTPTEHRNKTSSSLCDKTSLAQELLLAGLHCVSLPLPCKDLQHPTASQPGTPMDALALCPWAPLTEHQQHLMNSFCELQSNPLITLGKVFSHIMKAGSYQLPGEPNWAAQPQPKPSAFMSPCPFSRQNNPTHIPCFSPSSALLGSCICSHAFHHNTPLFPLSFITSFLPTCAHGQHFSYAVAVLKSQVLPHCIRNHSLGKISLLFCVITAGLGLHWAVHKNAMELSEGLSTSSIGGCTEFYLPVLQYQPKRSLQFPGAKETQLICIAKTLFLV